MPKTVKLKKRQADQADQLELCLIANPSPFFVGAWDTPPKSESPETNRQPNLLGMNDEKALSGPTTESGGWSTHNYSDVVVKKRKKRKKVSEIDRLLRGLI